MYLELLQFLHLLNYYSYHFWIKKPEKLVRDFVYNFFVKSLRFSKVITNYSEGDPDWILKSRVKIIEEYDQLEIWFARLKMEIEIKDFKSGETLLVHNFDQQRRLPTKSVERVPVALSSILQKELEKLMNKMKL